jgi:hypothetical protein
MKSEAHSSRIMSSAGLRPFQRRCIARQADPSRIGWQEEAARMCNYADRRKCAMAILNTFSEIAKPTMSCVMMETIVVELHTSLQRVGVLSLC